MEGVRACIHIITGSTAAGKTELALEWAVANNAEIVSCDSLLFYRGMDIGTAKPTKVELARVPHHLIDILSLSERMDVKRYAALARAAVADILSRGRQVLVVGGSGFYLKSFLAPVADDIAVDPALRKDVAAELSEHGLAAMVERLRKLNPGGLGGLDTANPRRVTRALERCLASGMTLIELERRFRETPPPYSGFDVRIVEIVREDGLLRRRIRYRARTMLDAGLVDEVKRLRGEGLHGNPIAAGAIGYREVLEWLESGGNEQPLCERIAANTWRLARKQRTWFRTQLPPHKRVELTDGARQPVLQLFD